MPERKVRKDITTEVGKSPAGRDCVIMYTPRGDYVHLRNERALIVGAVIQQIRNRTGVAGIIGSPINLKSSLEERVVQLANGSGDGHIDINALAGIFVPREHFDRLISEQEKSTRQT